MRDQLIIFDTTMRDGEQSPGASMTKEEKVRIGRQLEKLRVDVIEAGFAAASPGDFDAIRAVAEAVKDSTVCSLARANDNDVTRAGEAIKGANAGRIHTFIATSPIHMKLKLRMEPDAFPKLLTEREQRVLEVLGSGLSNEEASRELKLSRYTVQLHRRNIMNKLGLHRTPDLVRYAVSKGFSKISSFREKNEASPSKSPPPPRKS